MQTPQQIGTWDTTRHRVAFDTPKSRKNYPHTKAKEPGAGPHIDGRLRARSLSLPQMEDAQILQGGQWLPQSTGEGLFGRYCLLEGCFGG